MFYKKYLRKKILKEAVEDNLGIRSRVVKQVYYKKDRRFFSFMLANVMFVSSVGVLLFFLTGRKVSDKAVVVKRARFPDVVSSYYISKPPLAVDLFFPFTTFAAIPLDAKVIVLDPGHGGNDLGARGFFSVVEKDLTLDIARRVEKIMEARGFSVFMTREEDRFVELRKRSKIAKEVDADIFISVHANWFRDRRVRGVETYYVGATDDPHLSELARRENMGSGYTIAEAKELLDQIYLDIRRNESRKLAVSIHNKLVSAFGAKRFIIDRGVRKAPFLVLVDTECPAVLVEMGYISNKEDANLFVDPAFREKIAGGIVEGVIEYIRETQMGG